MVTRQSRVKKLAALVIVLPLAFGVASIHPRDPRHWSELLLEGEFSKGFNRLGGSIKQSSECLAKNMGKLDPIAPGEKMSGDEYFETCTPIVNKGVRAFRWCHALGLC